MTDTYDDDNNNDNSNDENKESQSNLKTPAIDKAIEENKKQPLNPKMKVKAEIREVLSDGTSGAVVEVNEDEQTLENIMNFTQEELRAYVERKKQELRRDVDAPYSLKGKFLIATPELREGIFQRSVVFITTHSYGGVLGFIINKEFALTAVSDLVDKETGYSEREIMLYIGGPVEESRGFILHSDEYQQKTTVDFGNGICLTATNEIVNSIAGDDHPKHYAMYIGCSGWGKEQLDNEILANSWIVCDGGADLLFNTPVDDIYNKALESLGITEESLSHSSGFA